MLALELKQIPYAMQWMEPSQDALKSPAYLEVNPRGKVPTLRHGDFVLPESMAIIAYLDRRFPEPVLLGDCPQTTGEIWQLILDFDLYVSQQSVGQSIVPLFFGQADAQADVIRTMSKQIHA